MSFSSSRERFDLPGEGGHQSKGGPCTRTAIIVTVLVVCLAFTVGLLVGHYGIEKKDDDTPGDGVFLAGVPAAIIRDADLSITDVLLNEISGANIRENLRQLVVSPHVAGTPRDLEQATMLKNWWLGHGLDVAVTTPYDILLSYPDDTRPNKLYVKGADDTVVLESADNEAQLRPEENPADFPFPYLGYSGNGNVTGDIVYVNYGRVEDFAYLVQQGVNMTGCIILARYGNGGRSSKVRRSEEHGAVGVLLYSDPADYIAEWATDTYPDSIWIPETATSRGSIFMGTGDPLTPGYPAIASAFRFNASDPEANLPKIPALPISYAFARELISRLGGADGPDAWTGRLLTGNTKYRVGPGFENNTLKANLVVHTTNERKVSYNAFGMIRGEVEPDRYVMLGNHRDSWVLGAIDPSSGTATMMELSRVLGNLVKSGRWRPRRSIIFCSWGAEEFGLIGSTEWIEENSKTLDFRGIAYINMDIAVTGNYSVRGLGSPPIFTAMYNAAKKIPNPIEGESYTTLYDQWLARKMLKDPETDADLDLPTITTPGAGSDYGTFMQRAGITCADFRYDQNYAGEGVLFYPLYHTSYETLYAVDTLIDPGLKLHATIAMVQGELLRDLADSLILPFNMIDYVMFLRHYAHRFKANVTEANIKEYNLDTPELDRVIDLYETEATAFHTAVNKINKNNPYDVRRVNDQMMQIERTFLDPVALDPGLEQIKRHLVHGSTAYNGIPGASFPGLEDAIYLVRKEPSNAEYRRRLQYHFSVLVFTIQGAANSLRDTTGFLRESL